MDRDRRGSHSSSELPNLYDIFLCEVGSVQQYGVFVKIPGFKKNGLVHKSQMSRTKVDDPSDMVEVGDRVYCKVISIDKESGKIGVSMKVVNQTSGQDLDPGHVQTSLDEQRRKTGHKRDIPKIELGAVLDTTCRKCGGHGHLSQDCFHVPGAQAYSLLPDLDYTGQQHTAQHTVTSPKKLKKAKKEKKVKKAKKKSKKKKKHKHVGGDSDSASSDSDKPSNSKKKKKKRKSSSSDGSDSQSSDPEPSPKRRKSSSDLTRAGDPRTNRNTKRSSIDDRHAFTHREDDSHTSTHREDDGHAFTHREDDRHTTHREEHRDRDRHEATRRGWERDENQDRSTDRDRDRDRGREVKDIHRITNRDRDVERDRSRDIDTHRDWDSHRDRESHRDRDAHSSQNTHRDRSRDVDTHNDSHRDRDPHRNRDTRERDSDRRGIR